MNASKKTAIIARGIYLWARVQDMPRIQSGPRSEAMEAWNKWAFDYKDYVEFVKREQYKLFDRVIAQF